MISIIGQSKRRIDRGWRVTGVFQFSTTDLTGYLPIDSDCPFLTAPPLVWSGGAVASGLSQTVEANEGTISASSNFEMQAPIAGVVSAAQFVVHTTVATDAANIWTIGVINKAAGAGTNVVVDIATATNSNNSTGGAAFTANTPRSLTLSPTPANLVVAAGDNLEWTFTKASSAANLVALELFMQFTPNGAGAGEIIGINWTSLLQTSGQSAGLIVPTIITSITPNAPAIQVTRAGPNVTSGLYCGFSYEGGAKL